MAKFLFAIVVSLKMTAKSSVTTHFKTLITGTVIQSHGIYLLIVPIYKTIPMLIQSSLHMLADLFIIMLTSTFPSTNFPIIFKHLCSYFFTKHENLWAFSKSTRLRGYKTFFHAELR